MSLGQPLENQGLLLALLLLPEAHHQPTAHERVVGARGRTQTRGGNAVEFATLNVGDGEHVVSFRLVCCEGLSPLGLMTVVYRIYVGHLEGVRFPNPSSAMYCPYIDPSHPIDVNTQNPSIVCIRSLRFVCCDVSITTRKNCHGL